jgi:putative SOS response-associated peptidase YedK
MASVCGRYWLVTPFDVLASRFHVSGERMPIVPRWNAAPGQELPVIRADARARGARVLEPMRWGLVPSWVDNPEDAGRPINARSETAATKPSFKEPLQRRRVLVPADGFFEWKKQGDRGREPFAIRLKTRSTFAFAGLFDEWKPRGGAPLRTFAILTTRPNELVATLHDRMPVILSPEGEDLWLDPGVEDPARLRPLFEPPDSGTLEAFAVSRHVNAPAHDDPAVLDPPAPEPAPPARAGEARAAQRSLWENVEGGDDDD